MWIGGLQTGFIESVDADADLISQSQMYLEEIAKRRNDRCCDMQPLETNWFSCENAAVIVFLL